MGGCKEGHRGEAGHIMLFLYEGIQYDVRDMAGCYLKDLPYLLKSFLIVGDDCGNATVCSPLEVVT